MDYASFRQAMKWVAPQYNIAKTAKNAAHTGPEQRAKRGMDTLGGVAQPDPRPRFTQLVQEM
jgi:hypothetical protein